MQEPQCKGKVPTWFSSQLFNQLHNTGTTAVLCALPPITLLPSGAPSLAEIPHRQKAIESCGPLSPDVADMGHLLEVVDWHIVSVILPLMFLHAHLLKFVH